ncbi:hypothetical protein BVRB_4g081580 [Beta vulgaris subsp. vulgaris]|nr:hypothetical protein BVRB_4g081580 [Beta vulgaris subsp. vulgaris]
MLVHHQRRHRGGGAICMIVIILASIVSQVFGGRSRYYEVVTYHATYRHEQQGSTRSNVDQINIANYNTSSSRTTTSTSHHSEGFVANSKRVVPTGPDPLHNREDQT